MCEAKQTSTRRQLDIEREGGVPGWKKVSSVAAVLVYQVLQQYQSYARVQLCKRTRSCTKI